MNAKTIIKRVAKYLLKISLSIVGLFFVLITVIIISNSIKTPSLDRQWAEDSKILPEISISENIIQVKNIRDWRYGFETITSKNYYEDVFDLDKIEKTYLLFNPFGKWDGIGHSFFLFEFSDGKTVSVSIEARRESDEGFNSLKGLFNVYELWYAYGSSADFLTRRAVHYKDGELNMYPLAISKETSKDLFLDLAVQTHKLQTEAQFYNTITSNCTNLLMNSANRIKPGSVPFHYSRLLTGFADDYAYKLELIPSGESFEDVNKKYRIDFKIKEIDDFLTKTNRGSGNYSNEEFWNIFYEYFKGL